MDKTANKTAALIANAIYYSPLHGMPMEDCEAVALRVAEALAVFEPPTLRMVGAQCSCGKQMTVTQEYPFEQPAVREMSVDEVVEVMSKDAWCCKCDADFMEAAKALAKLGTIRVVEKDNG